MKGHPVIAGIVAFFGVGAAAGIVIGATVDAKKEPDKFARAVAIGAGVQVVATAAAVWYAME